MMLDKKQIRVIFLFEFKMGCKSAETTCNINNAFGPGTANEHTVQLSFKNFSKGDESLEHKEYRCQPLQGDNNQLRALSKLILYNYKRLAEELNVKHSTVFQYLKQIGKVKKLDKWVSHELTAKKKIVILKCSPLILCNNNQPFLNRI